MEGARARTNQNIYGQIGQSSDRVVHWYYARHDYSPSELTVTLNAALLIPLRMDLGDDNKI